MEVKVEVAKEAYELGLGLSKFLGTLKEQLANGWQPIGDLPPIIASAVRDLVPALDGADKIPAEYAADKPVMAATSGLVGGQVLGAFLK